MAKTITIWSLLLICAILLYTLNGWCAVFGTIIGIGIGMLIEQVYGL